MTRFEPGLPTDHEAITGTHRGKARWARALGGLALAAALALALIPLQAAAQKFPERPLRLVMPFAPGGVNAIVGRRYAQDLTRFIGQNVIVDNRGGAAGAIGSTEAARAKPDGHTLVIANTTTHVINQIAVSKLPYDALKDFEPISLLARAPIVPYSSPSFAPTNLKELVALAKQKPGTLNFGSAGPGSMTHLVAEMLKIQAGIDMTHVVYRGGTPAMNDVTGGHTNMMLISVSSALPSFRAGKVKMLGIGSAKRLPQVADVPTLAEGGPGAAFELALHEGLLGGLLSGDLLAALDLGTIELPGFLGEIVALPLANLPGGPRPPARPVRHAPLIAIIQLTPRRPRCCAAARTPRRSPTSGGGGSRACARPRCAPWRGRRRACGPGARRARTR